MQNLPMTWLRHKLGEGWLSLPCQGNSGCERTELGGLHSGASLGHVAAVKASGSKRSVFDLRAVTYEGGNCQAHGVAARMTSEFLSRLLPANDILLLLGRAMRCCTLMHPDCRSFRICPTFHSPTTWSCRTCADLPMLSSISCSSSTVSGLADIARHSQ